MGKHSRSKVRWRRTRQEKHKARLKAKGHKFMPPGKRLVNPLKPAVKPASLTPKPVEHVAPPPPPQPAQKFGRWDRGTSPYWLCGCQYPNKNRRMRTTLECPKCGYRWPSEEEQAEPYVEKHPEGPWGRW